LRNRRFPAQANPTLVETVLYNNYLRARGRDGQRNRSLRKDRGPRANWRNGAHGAGDADAGRCARIQRPTSKIYDEIRKLFAGKMLKARRLGRPRPATFRSTSKADAAIVAMARGRWTIENALHGGPRSEVRGVRRAPLPEPHSRDSPQTVRTSIQVLDLTIDEGARILRIATAIPRDREAVGNRLAGRRPRLPAIGAGPRRRSSGGEAQRLKLARFLLTDLETRHGTGDDGKPLPRMFPAR